MKGRQTPQKLLGEYANARTRLLSARNTAANRIAGLHIFIFAHAAYRNAARVHYKILVILVEITQKSSELRLEP